MSGDNAHIAKLRECLCIYLPDGYITLIRALRRGLKKKNFKNDFRNVASSASNRKSQTVETKQKTKQTSMPKNRLMPKN